MRLDAKELSIILNGLVDIRFGHFMVDHQKKYDARPEEINPDSIKIKELEFTVDTEKFKITGNTFEIVRESGSKVQGLNLKTINEQLGLYGINWDIIIFFFKIHFMSSIS